MLYARCSGNVLQVEETFRSWITILEEAETVWKAEKLPMCSDILSGHPNYKGLALT